MEKICIFILIPIILLLSFFKLTSGHTDCYEEGDRGKHTYTGNVSQTRYGKKCKPWNSFNHPYTKYNHSFCRNADNEVTTIRPWCYFDHDYSRIAHLFNPVGWEYCDIPLCKHEEQHHDCYEESDNGMYSYVGTLDTTASGYKCERWDSDYGFFNSPYKKKYNHNFCRTPDIKRIKPWCYKVGFQFWEYCDVPVCKKPPGINMNQTPSRLPPGKHTDCYEKADRGKYSYVGTLDTTVSGTKCQNWGYYFNTALKYPYNTYDHNYCRTPNDEASRPWCYTGMFESQWEYCDIPVCN